MDNQLGSEYLKRRLHQHMDYPLVRQLLLANGTYHFQWGQPSSWQEGLFEGLVIIYQFSFEQTSAFRIILKNEMKNLNVIYADVISQK